MLQKGFMDVFQESLQDDSFREALLKDHHVALKSKEWELSKDEMNKLDDFMRYNQVASPSQILEAFSTVAKGTPLPPPPAWSPDIPQK